MGVFLEGGYDLEAGRACGQAVGSSLVDRAWLDPLGSSPSAEGEDWRQILAEAKNIWDL
jgi:hypothetical protein